MPTDLVAPSWHRLRRALHLIGLGLFVWIVAQLDMGRTVKTLAEANIAYLTLYVALYFGAMMLRMLRLRQILIRQGSPITWGTAYEATIEASLLGSVTPARAGEAVKVFSLKQAGVPVNRGFLAVVLERVFDLVVFFVFALCGVLYFSEFVSGEGWLSVSVIAFTVVVGGIAAYLLRGYAIERIGKVVNRLWTKWGGEFPVSPGAALEAFHSGLAVSWRMMLMYSFFIGALGALEVYCLAHALGMEVSFFHLIFSYAAASLVALAPISFNGLGTREATYIFLLGLESVGAESAMLLSILDGLVLPLLLIAFLSVPLWLKLGNPLARNLDGDRDKSNE